MLLQPKLHVPASEHAHGALAPHKDPLLCTPPHQGLMQHAPKLSSSERGSPCSQGL